MFHVNTYASVTKVSIIKEDLMMMMTLVCQALVRCYSQIINDTYQWF